MIPIPQPIQSEVVATSLVDTTRKLEELNKCIAIISTIKQRKKIVVKEQVKV